MFIKHDVAGDVYAARGLVKASKTLMVSTVSEENTPSGAKTEFTVIVWPQIWPTRAAENAQEGVIDGFLE
jgi:hypothetical protein